MTPERLERVRYRLSRARGAIEAAGMLLAGGLPADAVNRIYYACFYAASALLASAGLAARKHKGVISLFDQHWVKTGRLRPEASVLYHALFDRRLEGDYRDLAHYDPADVEAWLAEAREFVATIAAILQAAQ